MLRGKQVQHYRINMVNFAIAANANGPASPFSNLFTFQDYFKIVSLETQVNIALWTATTFLMASQLYCNFIFAAVGNYDITIGNPVTAVANAGGPVVAMDTAGIRLDMAGDQFVKNFDLDYMDYFVTPNQQYRNDIVFRAAIQSGAATSVSISLDFGFIKENPY